MRRRIRLIQPDSLDFLCQKSSLQILLERISDGAVEDKISPGSWEIMDISEIDPFRIWKIFSYDFSERAMRSENDEIF